MNTPKARAADSKVEPDSVRPPDSPPGRDRSTRNDWDGFAGIVSVEIECLEADIASAHERILGAVCEPMS